MVNTSQAKTCNCVNTEANS